MSEPDKAHAQAIHVTSTSSTSLSDSNKLQETSSFTLNGSHTTVDRMNLNSDGHTQRGVTWHSYDGSLEGKAMKSSTVQGTIETAALAGTSVWIHVIDNPGATTGQQMGTKYEVVFSANGKTWSAGEYVSFSYTYQVSGAPTAILAS